MFNYIKNVLLNMFLFFFVTRERNQSELEIVSVKFPINIKNSDITIFQPESTYIIRKKNPKLYKNVFLTQSGILFKNFKIIGGSIHLLKNKIPHFYLYIIWSYFFKKKKTLINTELYVLIHNHWSNGFYHWVTEALPRLWSIMDSSNKLILLLPESYDKFQKQSLESIKFKKIIYIPKNTVLKVSSIILPPNPAECGYYNPKILKEIREYYHSLLNINDISINFGERIYISRPHGTKRTIANEHLLIEILNKYEFKIINAERYNFIEQISIMEKTKYLISIHGAGLANILFMKEGGSVFELQKKITTSSDFYSSVYYTLANAMNINYYYQFCDPINKYDSIFKADLLVDIKLFEENIKLMTNN